MLVQQVLMPVSRAESWTLLGDDGEVVEPVERYLAYLAAIERSPNTVRAYAISLKLWFEFLSQTHKSWDHVGIEDVARFAGMATRSSRQRDRAVREKRGATSSDDQQVSGRCLRLLRPPRTNRAFGRRRARRLASDEPRLV